MLKRFYYNFLIVIFFTVISLQIASADDNSSFPFDKQCLKFDKANFKVGQALIDVLRAGDFPQYCILYSLKDYKIKQKSDDGYFIIGSKSDAQTAQTTEVFLKSKYFDDSKPVGQWAYFIGPEDFSQRDGTEKEIYVFQQIDF